MGKDHPSVVEDSVRGIVRVEEARQRHMEGHYRHRHTEYEPQMRNLERKYGGGKQPYSNEAFWTEAGPIRERCNADARRLMVEDGFVGGRITFKMFDASVSEIEDSPDPSS